MSKEELRDAIAKAKNNEIKGAIALVEKAQSTYIIF